MHNRHFSEKDIGFSGYAFKSNNENDVFPKKTPGLIQACIDAIVGSAVVVVIAVAIAVRVSIFVGVKVIVRAGMRRSVVILVHVILGILGLLILTNIFRFDRGRGVVDGLASAIIVFKP